MRSGYGWGRSIRIQVLFARVPKVICAAGAKFCANLPLSSLYVRYIGCWCSLESCHFVLSPLYKNTPSYFGTAFPLSVSHKHLTHRIKSAIHGAPVPHVANQMLSFLCAHMCVVKRNTCSVHYSSTVVSSHVVQLTRRLMLGTGIF